MVDGVSLADNVVDYFKRCGYTGEAVKKQGADGIKLFGMFLTFNVREDRLGGIGYLEVLVGTEYNGELENFFSQINEDSFWDKNFPLKIRDERKRCINYLSNRYLKYEGDNNHRFEATFNLQNSDEVYDAFLTLFIRPLIFYNRIRN